jgi:hypothetical protein
MSWTITLPWKVPLSKNKDFPVNLNYYRNACFQELNKAKINFKELVSPLLGSVLCMESCNLQYVIFPPSKRECDISNICSVADKFFSDTLVSSGKITDDNFKVIPNISFSYGQVDPLNPRIEVTITPIGKTLNSLEPKDKDMQIILSQEEITEAITAYVGKQLTVADNFAISVALTSARNEGVSATVNLVPVEAKPALVGKPTPRKTAPTATTVVKAEVPTEALDQPVVEEAESAIAEEVPIADPEPTEETVQAPVVDEPVVPAVKPRSLFGGMVKPQNS